MKKLIYVTLIVGMFAWAIYDFNFTAESEKESNESLMTDNTGQESEEVLAELNTEDVGLKQGNIAPDFELTTLNGENIKLSDLRGEKVMLNFWASWCGPCRSEMPDMEKFYKDKDITILAVNLTDTEIKRSDVTEFIDQYALTFPVLMDEESEVADLYRIQPIPTSYLLDTEGRIHNVTYGALNYEQMVQEYEKIN